MGLMLWCGCAGPSLNTGSADRPDDAFGGVKCAALRPQTEPDLIGWDPASRAKLTTLREQGVVVVRYEAQGCDARLEVLSDCIADGKYEYHAQAETQSKVLRSANEVYADLPLGAAKLAGKIKGSRALRADYMLVGTHTLPASQSFGRDALKGAGCATATHVVKTLYIGGFAIASGETRELEASGSVFLLGEAGGAVNSSTEKLDRGGVPSACEGAQKDGKPSSQCSIPLRIALSPLADVGTTGAKSGTTSSTTNGASAAPEGKEFEEYGFWTEKPSQAGSAQEVVKEITAGRKLRDQVAQDAAPKYTGNREKDDIMRFTNSKVKPWFSRTHDLINKASNHYIEAYHRAPALADQLDILGEVSSMWADYIERVRSVSISPKVSPGTDISQSELDAMFFGALDDALEPSVRAGREPAKRCHYLASKNTIPLPAKCGDALKKLRVRLP